MILSKRAKEEENANKIKGYIWCRIDDIIQDLKHSIDEDAIIKVCLEILKERE